ncbi:hypothetical protein Ancab_015875 [Ancistrocladus abbreviatus]
MEELRLISNFVCHSHHFMRNCGDILLLDMAGMSRPFIFSEKPHVRNLRYANAEEPSAQLRNPEEIMQKESINCKSRRSR